MKAKDVKLFGCYYTRVSGALVLVRVTHLAYVNSPGVQRYWVSRVDNCNRLPKPRTAAALHPEYVEYSTIGTES